MASLDIRKKNFETLIYSRIENKNMIAKLSIIVTAFLFVYLIARVAGSDTSYPTTWSEYKTRFGKVHSSSAEEIKRFKLIK